MTASFWIILLAVVVYGGLHSWLASSGLKKQILQRYGQVAERIYRLVYNLVAVLTLLPVLILPVALIDVEIYRIPQVLWLLSIGLQILALLLLVAGVLQTGLMKFLGVCQLVRCEGDTPPKLVVTGLYRWVRHPLYTAGLVFIWLMPVMSWNLLAMNLGLTGYILIGSALEEKKLLLEYGQAYTEYRRKTSMLIPGMRLSKVDFSIKPNRKVS